MIAKYSLTTDQYGVVLLPSDEGKVVVPSPRVSAVRDIPLIDRTEEMQILRDAADRAVQGEGGVVFLHGEAGIGKTRLARELTIYARSRGMQVLSGRFLKIKKMTNQKYSKNELPLQEEKLQE